MTYTLISESFPIARKPYRCIWCGESILAGEKHRNEKSRYDGFQNHRWHLECDEAAQKEFATGDTEFLPYSSERPPKLEATDRTVHKGDSNA